MQFIRAGEIQEGPMGEFRNTEVDGLERMMEDCGELTKLVLVFHATVSNTDPWRNQWI